MNILNKTLRIDLLQQFITQWLKTLAALFLFLPAMSLFRIAAWLIYGNHIPANKELFYALWTGLRFDSVVLFYLLTLPTLVLCVLLIAGSKAGFSKSKIYLPVYINVLLLLVAFILAVDTKYYSYFQDHLNILVFGFAEDDTLALVKTFWRNYPVITYLFAFSAGSFALSQIVKTIFSDDSRLHRWINAFSNSLTNPLAATSITSIALSSGLCILFVVVFSFVGGRGSFGLFPLGPADTVVSREPFINYLTYNGVHALYRAVKLRDSQNTSWDNNLKYYGYSDPREAFADYFNIKPEALPADPLTLFRQKTKKNPWAEKTKPHVVVIVMESFGEFWLKFHSKDFNLLGKFEKHTLEDIFLRNFLPATGSTTGSLSSLMISSPQRPIGNFLTESQYLQVPFRSSPAKIFNQAGYQTRFIYGGNPGWRDMNKFAKFQGFSSVEGDIDIEAKLGAIKERHDWGIYDEDLFRYISVTLSEATKPQMLLVMTTTNHPPYQVPSSYSAGEQKIPTDLQARLVGEADLIKNRFRTYLYSNEKLGQFIDQIKASNLADKTLLAVTGDHGFSLVNFSNEEVFDRWSVPLYLYFPKASGIKIDNKTFASHMDIFPTLLSAATSNVEFDSLGTDIADPTKPHIAIHSSGLIANDQGAALQFSQKTAVYYQWNQDKTLLEANEPNDNTLRLANKYRSMMSLMDYYLLKERELSKSPVK